jgi:5,10-methylenetetrahydromethanopterin reductase
LSNTQKIKVGTGIVSPFRRHPTVLAEDAAALSELSSGRFILGLGSGPGQLKTMGIKVSQLQGLREAVEILRGLLSGDELIYPGKVFRILNSSALDVPPKVVPPIYIGGLLPKMIELASEIADGLLISRRGGGSLRYVGEITKSVRKREFTVRSFIESSIDSDRENARRTARQFLASYTIRYLPHAVVEKSGYKWEDVRAIQESEHPREDLIDERMIHDFSMTGTPSDCLEKLKSFEGTGVDVPILYIHGPSVEKGLELAGKEILPRLLSN